jgi:hypothetical protein
VPPDPASEGGGSGERLLAGSAAVAAVLFAVYAAGASRTIYAGDSGELVAAVHVLGIPHPSGYPLYVLLGKLWTILVPFGSIAFRMSLFSAACAAAACGGLHALCRRMGLGAPASVLAALLLGFGPSFWAEANVQRTYALNALFVVAATAAARRWHERRRAPALAAAFAICGLGAANHLFMAVFAGVLAAFAIAAQPALLRRPAAAAGCALAFAGGLAPYVYLPLRSRMDPLLDWGDPESLGGFLRVVFRGDFWERRFVETPRDLLPVAGDYLAGLGAETAWAGAILAAAGAAAFARRGRFVLLPLLAMGANAAAVALHGSRTDIFVWHRYYIPSYAMAALLAGAGWDRLAGRIPRAARWSAILLPAVLLVSGWRDNDRSRYRITEDFSRRLLASLPPGAHLIASDDNILFTLIYVQFVEGARPDVDLVLQGVGEADLPPLRFDPDRDPVFLTHHPNWSLPELELVPVGLAFRAWRAGRPAPEPAIGEPWLDGERDPRVPKDHLTRNLIGHFHYMLGVTFEGRDWLRARAEFARAAAAAPDNDVLFYNLGLIFRRNGLLDASAGAFRRAHAVNPRHLASRGRPRALDRIAEVESERRRVASVEARLASDPSLDGLRPDSPEHHARMAVLLDAAGEPAAARGRRLWALKAAAEGVSP